MAKRANGEGCTRQLNDGRWESRIAVKDPLTGKYQTKTFSRKTKKAVVEWLNKIRAEIHDGRYIGDRKLTLKEWLETWLHVYAQNKVRTTTWESYESVLRIHVIPSIGHLQLQQLRPEHLQMLYGEKLREGRVDGKGGLSHTTVRYMN